MAATTSDPRMMYGFPIARLSIVDSPKTPPELKKLWLAYMLWIPPLGIFGAHHFYLGRKTYGLIYAVSLGNILIGWLVDFLRMKRLVQRSNEELWMVNNHNVQDVVNQVRYVDDCYILQFPFGLFGAVQFYLRHVSHGFIYLFTVGGLLCLWTTDMFRMSFIVQECNEKISGYDDYVIKLERLRSGFIESLSRIPSVDHHQPIESITRHSPRRASLSPPNPDGAPPSYEDVLNRGSAAFPVVRPPVAVGADNAAFQADETHQRIEGEEEEEEVGVPEQETQQ